MLSFIEFLILEQEVNVTISGEDPVDSLNKAKQMTRQAAGDPQRAIKQREQNLKNRKKEVAAIEDPDIKRSEEDILRDEQRVAQKRRALARDKERKEMEKERETGITPAGAI